MRTSSAKAKGRRLQQELRDALLEQFPQLQPDDIRSTGMGQSGEDLLLSPAARALLPFAFECKNQEALSIWSALEQAAINAKNGVIPALVFRRNHTQPYVALPFAAFLKLISQRNDLTPPTD